MMWNPIEVSYRIVIQNYILGRLSQSGNSGLRATMVIDRRMPLVKGFNLNEFLGIYVSDIKV